MERATASELRCGILDRKTLRGRLGLAYAASFVVALALFAAIALGVVDRAQRSALDAQLQSIADAERVVGDVRGTHLSVDAADRAQFRTIAGAKGQSAIAGTDGIVLVSTNDRVARAIAKAERPRVDASYGDITVAHERLRVFATPIRNGRILVGQTLAWGDGDGIAELDRRVGLAFALAIPLLVLVAVLVGSEVARRGLAPLGRIAALASEIEAHDLSKRLAIPARDDELGKLTATFDRMLDRLQNAFDRERRFTNDASHELRAPLSVIRAEADLALRRDRTVAEYRRALETIATEADSLEALARDLLAAARDGSAVEDVRAPVDLALVANTAVERLSPIAGARTFRVRAENDSRAIVAANRVLVERAIVGVLHNALKYAPETGRVDIRLCGGEDHVELTVGDDGPGFSTIALQRAFDRFWRDDAARTLEGSGLGLSLAKTIVERYGGTIVLANAIPHGAVVTMTFPAAAADGSDGSRES